MSLYTEQCSHGFCTGFLDTPEIGDPRKRRVEGAHGDALVIGFGTEATLPFYNREIISLSVAEPSTGMTECTDREKVCAMPHRKCL